jgi:uncharacterized protein YegL
MRARFFGNLLSLKPNEQYGVFLFFLVLLVFSFGASFARSIGMTLLIGELGGDSLPFMFIFIDLSVMVGSMLYANSTKKFGGLEILGFFLLSTVLFSVIAQFLTAYWGERGWVYGFFFVGFFFFYILISIHTGSVVASYFRAVQVRRVTPIINAGIPIGGVLGGSTLVVLLRVFQLQPQQLIVVLGAACLGAFGLLCIINARLSPVRAGNAQSRSSPVGELTVAFKYIIGSRLMIYMSLGLILFVIANKLLEYHYQTIIYPTVYPDATDRAVFFATYEIFANLAWLVVQLFLTSRLVMAWGVGASNVVYPVLSAMVALALVIFFYGKGLDQIQGSTLMLSLGILTQFINQEMRGAWRTPINNLLFNAIPPNQWRVNKAFFNGIVFPLSTVIAGTFLILITGTYTGTQSTWSEGLGYLLPAIAFVVSVLAIVVALPQWDAYDKGMFGLLHSKIFNRSSNVTPKAKSSHQDKHLVMSSQTQPLPHNGLFIRRNSAFGTKLSTSLKELIAQGVMVEQQNIRFDDFVAMKTSGIPSPTANHALAVSHGIAAIPAYQQHDNRATHYLEIALKTADAAPVGHLETQAPPVNYIFVVDVSGSMWGEKIDTVKASIRELFTHLRPDDVIGVIAFDDNVKTLLESTPKQNISPDDFGQIINRLIANGSTDINLALSISIDEMRRYRGAQRVNQLFLFSDGNPNHGETDWVKIRQNIAAKMRQNTATDGNIRLSTFVFGTDANKIELDKLAGITGGQSTFVIEPEEDVRDSLQQELDRRTHLAAINVQMQINIDSDIEILHFYGHDLITDPAVRVAVEREADLTGKKVEQEYGVKPQPDLIKEDKGIRVFVPNLAVGETYWVVFELVVPEQHQPADFGNATVQYFDTFVCQNQKPQFDLSQQCPITPQWVAQHALGLWTSEVASYALYDVEAKDLATAEKRIGAHISVLETARSQLMGQTSATSIEQVALIDDIITLNKFLSLAQNLNQGGGDGVEMRHYLNYGLGELDRLRNGFVYRVRD